MAWLHTWSGLLLGWLLFMIFLAGTASYFREEISRYTRPEVQSAALDVPRAVEAAGDYLRRHAMDSERWFITPPTPRTPGGLSVFWRDSAGESHSHGVDARSVQRLLARETRGGDFFYRLHFDLHYLSARTARWIVGFAAMMMFVALVTGVITHRKIEDTDAFFNRVFPQAVTPAPSGRSTASSWCGSPRSCTAWRAMAGADGRNSSAPVRWLSAGFRCSTP